MSSSASGAQMGRTPEGRSSLSMRYEAPTTTKEAVSLMAKARSRAYVLAGGTDLLVRLKSGAIEPELIVDIKRIEATQSIKQTANGFRIGAAVPAVAMRKSAALRKAWPGVVEAANLIGSDQIQGRCTIAVCLLSCVLAGADLRPSLTIPETGLELKKIESR